jgi:hypothetical protein
MASTATLQTTIPPPMRTHRFLRALFFLYVVLVACPIRYWAISNDWDNTWVFALNYAAAHGLAHGRDIVWNTGPLGHLVFPQDIGSNLSQALVFQTALWIMLIAVLADLFFRSGILLRNLVPFSALFGLSAPLFWFNRVGLENLLLAAALILLVVNRWRGGMARYVAALVFLGLTPLIKPTAAIIGGGAVAGFLVERVIALRRNAWPYVALAVVIPTAITGLVLWLTVPSLNALSVYLHSTMDIAEAYSVAISVQGPAIELVVALETMVIVGGLLALEAFDNPRGAAFLVLMLALPMFVSFKHGFVRQDVHVVNFFCFAALAMGLFFLQPEWPRRRWLKRLILVLPFAILWQDYVPLHLGTREAVSEAAGLRAAPLAWHALFGFASLHDQLRADAERSFPPERRLESEIRAIIGDSPVASLSVVFAGAALDDLNIQIYPMVQGNGAFTPYLDGLNAAWFRERGPRFLTFDGFAIDRRQPWAETPQTWLEIYRWYDTRLLGSRNVLLERRAEPRFLRLERIGGSPVTSRLALPASPTPVFWSMQCDLTRAGRLRKMLFRVPVVTVELEGNSQARGIYRVIMDVVRTPVMGSFLPTTLVEFAELLRGGTPTYSVSALTFAGNGLRFYSSPCQVELWRVAP